jgi:hypothetical protein
MDDLKQKHSQLFFYLISSFEMAAMQQMGKIKNPLTDKIEKDLDQAKFSIDLLDMLKDKTNGNLTEDENKYFEHLLGQLKLNFLYESEQNTKEKEKTSEKSPNNIENKEDN